MSRLSKRVRRLEDPRSPRERERAKEAAQKRRELEERRRRWFEAIAEHPERVPDYLEAVEGLNRSLEGLPEDASRVEVRDATDAFLEAEQLFEHGYVSGICCEDCGRAGEHYSPGSYVGTCRHCGGVTSWYGYWLKRVIPLEKLEAEIAATQSLGYEEKTRHLEALMVRRLEEALDDVVVADEPQERSGDS